MADTKDFRPDDDPRSDIEQVVEARKDAVEAGDGGSGDSPLEPTGVDDGVSGTAGVVKNQQYSSDPTTQ